MPPSPEQIAEYSGTLIMDIEKQVERAEAISQRTGKFTLALATYLFSLSGRLLEHSTLPLDHATPDYIEKINIQRGLIEAAGFVRKEASALIESGDAGQKLIRERLDLWMQGRVGCDD